MDRRLKILRVNKDWLLDIIRDLPNQVIGLPTAIVPAGCKTEAVDFDSYRDCWVVRLSHPSFDIVPDGDEIPIANEFISRGIYRRRPVSDTHEVVQTIRRETSVQDVPNPIEQLDLKPVAEFTIGSEETPAEPSCIQGVAEWRDPSECDVIADLNVLQRQMGLPEFKAKPVEAASEPAISESWRDRVPLL